MGIDALTRLLRHSFQWLALLGIALPATVIAQTPAERRDAQLHVEMGVDHFRAARYQEAVVELRKAHAVLQDPLLVWNIARSYEELGDVTNALHYFNEVVTKFPDASLAKDAKKHIAALEPRLPGRLTVHCGGIASAQVLIDRKRQGSCGDRFDGLKPGEHLIEVSAAGRGRWSQSLKVEPKGRYELEVDWSKAIKEPPPVTSVAAAPTASAVPKEAVRWPALVALGAGASLLAAGAAFAVALNGSQERRDQQLDGGSYAAFEAADKEATNRALGANVCLGLGTVAAITGAVMFLSAEAAPAQASLSPVLAPGYVGLTWRVLP